MPKFSTQHYNAIAKDIREELSKHYSDFRREQEVKGATQALYGNALVASAAVTDLAIKLTRRFAEDNPQFKPLKFLDACSPDVDLYPLSELWEEE